MVFCPSVRKSGQIVRKSGFYVKIFSLTRIPTIHRNEPASHKPSIIRTQKINQFRDFFRSSDASERMFLFYAILNGFDVATKIFLCRVLNSTIIKIGFDGARANAIHADIKGCAIESEALGHLTDSAFSCAINEAVFFADGRLI